MATTRCALAIPGLLALAAQLAAQQSAPCRGPGAAFGVTGYQCASCGIKQGATARTEYIFNAEPIVMQTTAASLLRPGDVVEAVNGQPITTRAGAEGFAYPRAGSAVIRVRRGSRSMELTAPVAESCGALEPAVLPEVRVDSGRQIGQPLGPTRRFESATARFGFAVACLPSCTRAKTSTGEEYWKFDGYPPIARLRIGGPAERMGLRVSDVITAIDGKSILEEAGALSVLKSFKNETLHVTVLRDGKQIGYLLRADP